MKSDNTKFGLMTTESPPRYLEIAEIGHDPISNIPQRRQFVLNPDKAEMIVCGSMKQANKLAGICEVLYPRIRMHIRRVVWDDEPGGEKFDPMREPNDE